MWWECSECGNRIEQRHRPIECHECGIGGPVFMRLDPLAGELGDDVSWQDLWIRRGVEQRSFVLS